MALEFTEQPVQDTGAQNSDVVQHFKEIYVGAGNNRLVCNQDGFGIGASNYADAPFRVDWSGNVVASSLTIVGGVIRAGQTAYNTGTGYWIGTDSGTPKFSIGNGSTKYLTWDGSALTIRGTLNADDIVAGTLVGRTVKAVGSGSASDVWVDGNIGELAFYYDGVKIADLYSDTSGRILLSTGQTIYLAATGDFFASGADSYIVATGDNNNVFNDDGGSDSCRWINDNSLTMEHRDNGDLAISGSYL